MREFVAKTKKLKVTINGVSHEMRCPNIAENESLTIKLKESPAENALTVYKEFFSSLGLSSEVMEQMDSDDFLDFIQFVLAPKKNQAT